MIISIIYFLFLQNENLRCPSKSVPDLGLNKDLLYLLSGPTQMTTLPFLVYTAILGFIIAFRGKKFGKNIKIKKKENCKEQPDILVRFHFQGTSLAWTVVSNWKQMCNTWAFRDWIIIDMKNPCCHRSSNGWGEKQSSSSYRILFSFLLATLHLISFYFCWL